jgi:tousled-like kinase
LEGLLSRFFFAVFSEFQAWDVQEMAYVACKVHHVSAQWPTHRKENYIKHSIRFASSFSIRSRDSREYKLQERLRHDRIVALYDAFEVDVNTFCTVMEYCEGGDLDLELKDNVMFKVCSRFFSR